jgi:hypothetical protein
MRRVLAVRGYNGLRHRIEVDVNGKVGTDALRAMATAMREFAFDRPGLSAATFRSPVSDCADWRQARTSLLATAYEVFSRVGIEDDGSVRALRILRSIVRGFVLSEMAGSFFVDAAEYKETFDLSIEQFILGLPALTVASANIPGVVATAPPVPTRFSGTECPKP